MANSIRKALSKPKSSPKAKTKRTESESDFPKLSCSPHLRIKNKISSSTLWRKFLASKIPEPRAFFWFKLTKRPEEYIIKQGDSGNHLYVVDSGKLACSKLFPNNTEPTFLKHYEPGESFGELALLYNAPRAATIQAVEESVLFALDRETFNHIVKDAAMKKRQYYESFLANLEILSNMDDYERSKIADAAKRVKVSAGEYVVKQVNRFF